MHTNIKKQIYNYFLVAIGTFLLAFGSVIFLNQCNIVDGGISGISIIIKHYIPGDLVYPIVYSVLTIFFWLIGLIFIGKDYAFKSLFSSIICIGFIFMLELIPFFNELAKEFAGNIIDGKHQAGNLILCGIFGGVCVGTGVGIAFLGGGSTGGVDVIMSLCSKYFKIKESISSIILEAVIIIIGMFTLRLWVESLCGILCGVVTSLLINAVYNRNQTSYQVDIISEKWKLISWYAQDQLGRGATIIHAEGGYQGDERIILRIVFDKQQYEKLRSFIAQTDPKAFVTFTQTNAVYGEGFNNNKSIDLKKLLKLKNKTKKDIEKEDNDKK